MWRQLEDKSRVIKGISIKLNGTLCKTVVQSEIMHGSKYWAVDRMMSVTEMKVLRWMSEMTKEGKITNNNILGHNK